MRTDSTVPRAKILFTVLIVIAALVTLLFGRDSSKGIGTEWTGLCHAGELNTLSDSLHAILADTVEIQCMRVESGGTLGGLLYRTGITGWRYNQCCSILMDSLGWRSVHVGDTLEAVYHSDVLAEVRARPIRSRGYYSIVFGKDGTAESWAWVDVDKWTRMRAVTMSIESSVWQSIANAAVPADLTPSGSILTARDSTKKIAFVTEIANAVANKLFVFDIDFYYDVRPGDSLWLLLEETVFPHTNEVSFRRIIAAKYKFSNGGITEALPYFHTPDSLDNTNIPVILDYYHRDGASLRTLFIKMPVPFGRISSEYSHAREHPILGYTRQHLGIDYASPLGTEIFAVGDGVITMHGWNGDYGNHVRIRHSNGYATGYGHMNGFVSGQTVGTYVRQGEIIGYVGSTGLSTGPHLHFEMLKNGSFVNPALEILPPADPLVDADLEKFLQQTPVLESIWSILGDSEIPVATQLPSQLPSDSTDAQ